MCSWLSKKNGVGEKPKHSDYKSIIYILLGLALVKLLSVLQFFILHVFIEKIIDRLDGKAGRDLSKGVDFHFESLQFFVYAGFFLFFFLFGHLNLRLLAYLTQIEFFWIPLLDLKSKKLPSGQVQRLIQ